MTFKEFREQAAQEHYDQYANEIELAAPGDVAEEDTCMYCDNPSAYECDCGALYCEECWWDNHRVDKSSGFQDTFCMECLPGFVTSGALP